MIPCNGIRKETFAAIGGPNLSAVLSSVSGSQIGSAPGRAEPCEPLPMRTGGFNVNIHEQAGLPEKRQEPVEPDPVSALALATALAVLAWVIDGPSSAINVFIAVLGCFRPGQR